MGSVLILVLWANSVTLGEFFQDLYGSYGSKIMTLDVENSPCSGVWPNVLLWHKELKVKTQPLLKGQPPKEAVGKVGAIEEQL